VDFKYLINRQPIFGSKINVVAYEVRTGPIAGTTPESSSPAGDSSPLAIFTESFLQDVVGANDCFITLPPQALAEGFWSELPKTRVVLSLFENLSPSDREVQQCLELLKRGYRVVVPDRLPGETLSLIGNRIQAIEVDAIGYNPAELETRVQELRTLQAKLVATNVDTYDDLEFCRSLGFDFFKGRFISRAASQGKEVPVNRLSLMRILAKLQEPDIAMSDLEKLVSQDVSLSFKLLRYANSAAISLPRKVSSVGHAARMLGLDMLRNWTRILLMSAVEDKPRELMVIALVRARMCELLSESLKSAEKESFFSAGLLSVLDALLDCTMEKALAELPLADEVKMALTHQAGQIGQALRCTLAYERADWDNVQFYGLPSLPIRDIYMKSIAWAQELTKGLITQ
jgi:EAL and modified HD-GYP domain-containing signal transduction protein